ncbi:MAG: 3'(2'),5'-bisphosphate nucleotidase [Planctomycetaceae bacterium]|nr:3'(2'),5'-bisphosphate nucleotidase [Planctomycetaceae bacterium]
MLEQERDFALETVRAAVQICRLVQNEITPGRWDKEDRTPVTVADLAVQAVVSRALEERFPDDPLMGEEESKELREPKWSDLLNLVTQHVHVVRHERPATTKVLDWIERGQQPIDAGRRYWVLDPVDGTKGFLRKEQYAIALALVERGEVLLGVLACPNLPNSYDVDGAAAGHGQLYVAVRGQGAQRCDLGPGDAITSRRPMRVSPVTDPAQAQWCERVESSDKNHDVTAKVVAQVGMTAAPRRLDSQAKYAVVARGDAVLYLRHSLSDYREKVWDHAAGVLVTHESGGRVTDIHGRPLDFSRGRQLDANQGIVATNGVLHHRVLAAVRDVLGHLGK